MAERISGGIVHKLPKDMREMLITTPKVKLLWEDITPLARNEWICWVKETKQEKTRKVRIEKTRSKMLGGMRRPCCWVGCTHRG